MSGLQEALPREHYVDAALHERERTAVLLREWTCIGRLDDLGLTAPGTRDLLPERLAVVDLHGESVLVTTDTGGALHGHYNVCRHRGSQVVPVEPGASVAPCAARSLRCPYHSWTYGLDGSLLHAPHTDGVDLDRDAFRLHPVGAAAWGGWLWLHGAPDEATDLLEALAPVPERVRRYPLDTLVLGRRLRYEVAANWKVVAENYNECYHCGPVHPELVRLVPAFGGGGQHLEWEDGVPHREGAWTFTMSGTTDRAPFPDLDEHERVRHKGELVYPNLLLSLSAEHAAAFVLRPRAVDRTEVVCDLLFAPDEAAKPTFDPSDAEELWDLTNKQDWAICESVQRGMSSRAYRQGWYAPMEDASLDIRRWLLPRLERHERRGSDD
ncbi:aromatic ring-hydroxylating oxygenase subunit alpha [Longivirga aurantiaca]|uniref:SRPBCC family protein n=1 Tax=Longivirga aurantiaca TaxID=1837743 RepID=A0ABW1SYW8_9ACTN